MNCHETEMMLMEYVAGTLDKPTQENMTRHLETCSSCSEELEREKVLGETLGSLPLCSTDERVGFIYPAQPNKWWLPVSGGLVAAAVLLAVLITGNPIITPRVEPSDQELAAATEDIKWTLNLANSLIQKGEKAAMVDLLGTKLPSVISGSLFPDTDSDDRNKS